MKAATLVFFVSSVAMLVAGSSLAAEVNIKLYSADDMKTACQKVGGSFSQDNSGYGCGTDCRGGAGTDCTVFCPSNAKRCTVQVGGSRRPKTFEQALAPNAGRKK